MKKNKFNRLKKIIPAVAILGASLFIGGCSNNLNGPDETKSNINAYQESINNYKDSVLATANTHNILNNYKLEISPLENENLGDPLIKLDENNEPILDNYGDNVNSDMDSSVEKAEIDAENGMIETDENTLYNLSTDIKENCQRYTKLKNEIINAINETENLLNKVKNKEITLNPEQKLMLTEQTKDLRDLGRKLTSITSELSYNIDDLNNKNFTTMPIKYLVILNNLIDGNEMMESGLHSIERINQTFYANRLNKMEGKITYRYKKEGEPEVFKEFQLKDGKLVETKVENNQEQTNEEQNENKDEIVEQNITDETDLTQQKSDFKQENDQNQQNTSENSTTDAELNSDVENTQNNENTINDTTNNQNDDTNKEFVQNEGAQNNQPNGQFLNSNIDTFYPEYRNIDTFYNTARNGYYNNFGYGFNNGLGYGGMENGFMNNGMDAPLGNNYGVDNVYNTPDVVQQENVVDNKNNTPQTNNENKTKKKKHFKKNVDSYRDADTPTPAGRIRNFKQRVRNLIGK